MSNLLKNKHILVAGAGGLLGSTLVCKALEEGAHVVATDLAEDELRQYLMDQPVAASALDNELVIRQLDVTCEDEVVAFFQSQTNLDGAVNATYPRNKQYGAHLYDVSLASFNENMALNLGSAFLFTQQCAKYFERVAKPFALVNVSSIYGVMTPRFDIYGGTSMTMPVEYAAIKAALQHLSKYVTAYVKNSDFRVNCVSPGGLKDSQPQSFLDAYQDHTHGKGMLNADDIVGTILFLLSDYSRFVTAQNIIVDDGFSL